MLSKELKSKIVEENGKNKADTGSAAVQIALLSERIAQITQHLTKNPKDKHSYNGLRKLIGRRRSLTRYASAQQR